MTEASSQSGGGGGGGDEGLQLKVCRLRIPQPLPFAAAVGAAKACLLLFCNSPTLVYNN